MSVEYKVGIGWNVPIGSLQIINPQPRSEGLRYARTVYTANGTVYTSGAYALLVWDALESDGLYQMLLNQFGLDTNKTSRVTMILRDDLFFAAYGNGIAVLPRVGEEVSWEKFRPRRITILIRDFTPIYV